MNKDFDEIVRGCQELKGRGVPIEDVISYLHKHGSTITESMKAVMEIYRMSLKDAKAIVSGHPVWKDVVAAAVPLHEELEREIARKADR